MKFTMGCDPELFLFDKELDRIVPAVGKIGGTKQEPLRLTDGTVQLDGTVIEIGTDPASSFKQFEHNLKSVLNDVRRILNEQFGDRYELRCGASAAYHQDDLDFDQEVLEVGCDPHFGISQLASGVVTLNVLPLPSSTTDTTNICTGGHIHVGFGCNMDITDIVLLDSVAHYVSSLSLPTPHAASSRRRYQGMGLSDYGCPIRIKPYGVELRAFDAYWLSSRSYTRKVWMQLKAHAADPNDYRSIPNFVNDPKYNKIETLPSKYQSTLPLAY
jgi:hypothetical protein